MPLKFYNTMTKKKGVFKPLKGKTVTMYNCGLTVYDYAHIGNLRAYTFADVIRRYLEYKGYKVKQVMNFTDVGHMTQDDVLASDVGEDKMELAAKREKKDIWQIADFYIKSFLEDSKKMNFEEPEVRPKPTKHIKEIIELIEKLIEKKHAYIINGSVYYDVSSFKDYGKLSGNTLKELKAGKGGRVKYNPDKKNQFDFALWISDPKHIMHWKSPWSEKGYPGWHIECSAMSTKYLGETIDIHTGGEDNIFPHHESEIAQSEGATGKKFVRYWMHTRHLKVEGKKMSKSLGNFYTLKDLKDYSPRALRYLLLSTHYRQKLNFTLKSLKATENAVEKLRDFTRKAKDMGDSKEVDKLTEKAKKDFEKAMDDDLNISEALAAIFNFVKEINKLGKGGKKVYEQMIKFDKVLGILDNLEGEELPTDIKKLIEERESARKKKEWEKADKIRDELKKKGIILEDTDKGIRWKRK